MRLARRARRCLLAPALASLLCAPAAGATISHVQLWTALGGDVVCGVAIHVPGRPATQVLCSSTVVPPPRRAGIGDPGFVFISSAGRPQLARLSQDTFAASVPVAIAAGRSWKSAGIAVRCTVSGAEVRCENRSRHGFAITEHSYRSF